nr:glycoside hydrolase family 97 protein [uncultured Arsenicibacter sp.]
MLLNRFLFFSLLFVFGLVQVHAQTTVKLASPDGKTRVDVTVTADKQLVYRLLVNQTAVVDWSVLGLQLRSGSIGTDASIVTSSTRTVKETIAWPLGENDRILNQFTETTVSCRSGATPFQVIFRLYNNSLAFRYVLTQPAGVISRELTTFRFTGPFTLYQYNEETVFTPTPIDAFSKTSDFPTTLTNGKLFVSVGEAANLSYTKAVLEKGTTPNTLAVSFKKDYRDLNKPDSVQTGDRFTSPWRTVSVSPTAIGLHAFSDLALRLSPPPAGGIPSWVKPGKLIRSYLTTQNGIDCIDFARKHNLQYIMFDAGWYGAEFRGSSDPTKVIEAIDMPKVIRCGKQNGIGVILYVNRVALRAKLDSILPLYQQWGVAGLKFGFVDGVSQEGIQWLAQALPKVQAHGFILDIHDNYKPTGLSRTYPNLLTQEGIRGNENNPDAYHNTVLPFTRFLAGAADYTFCYPNANKAFSDNLRKTKLQVSKGQQLALTVVYFSPLQAMFWYGNPNDYTNEGEIEFFSRVPTVWNESHYLSGEPGQHIAVARRQGKTWYLGTAAGLSDWSGTLTLSFLDKGKAYTATIYEDDGADSIRKRTIAVKKGDAFPVQLAAKGGQAVVIDPNP